MAEALLRQAAGEAGLEVVAASAGTAANADMEAADHAIVVMKEYGEDLNGHRSQGLTAELVGQQDLLLAMTARHAEDVRRRFPEAAARVYTLSDYVGSQRGDIADPFFGPVEEYRSTAVVLKELVQALVGKLKAQTGGAGP